MCSPNILLNCLVLFAFFTAAKSHLWLLLQLIFTLLAASISHFTTASIKFSCFSSSEIRLLCFQSLALALSLLSV